MEALLTPVAARRGRRSQATPGKRTPLSTPQSALTPNDDAAEKAKARKHRQAERMRKSLAGEFGGPAASGGAGEGPALRLSESELRTMLDLALKLAAENKINDRNVWSLPLIDHLPDMVQRAAPDRAAGGAGEGGAGGNYFSRISGGLDAGVQIYARRVDATWKQTLLTLRGAPQVDGKEGDSQDPEGSQDAGAAGADAKRRRRGGAEPREDDTLAEARQLCRKQEDSSFAVDPLFHHMSQIFDEDGAQGMLLLNRGVYSGSTIMFESGGVPEDHFPLAPVAAAQQEQEAAVDLTLLRPLLQQLQEQQRGAPPPGSCAAIAPAMRGLHALLAGQGLEPQADEAEVEADVAAIMAAVEGDCARFAAACRPRAAALARGASAGARPGASGAEGARTTPCAATGDGAEDDCMADSAAGPGSGDADMADQGAVGAAGWNGDAREAEDADSMDAADAVEGAARRAAERAEAEEGARLAEQYTQCDDDGGAYDDGGGDAWGCGGDDGDSDGEVGRSEGPEGASAGAAEEHALAGLGAVMGEDSLQWLLGAERGGGSGVMRGAGWAGSSYWRFQRAPGAAQAGGVAARKGADGGAKGKRGKRAADTFINFEAPPPIPAGALAAGTLKQTTLATCAPADTLLPEDFRYEAASLGRLFLKPGPIMAAQPRGDAQQQHQAWAADMSALDDCAAGGGGAHGDGGYSDDDDGGGGDYGNGGDGGYDSGGEGGGGWDGGFGGGAAGGDFGDGLEQDPEHELLQAPRRVAHVGVSYSRASKQVDVHALKDIIWGGVLRAGGGDGQAQVGLEASGAAQEAAEQPVDFRDVIKVVPKESPAGRLEDMSVHMCFICLLHLANQHGLEVKSGDDLRTLTVRGRPQAAMGG